MVWFKVDDRLHSHPKALATSLAALGLWTLAGSWSSDHLQDGFVSDQAVSQLSRGANELADELVAAGLWRRVRGGYRFHQWHEDGDGTPRNPTRKQVEQDRAKRAAAGRLGGLASGKKRSKRQADAEASASRIVEPPTRPDPFLPNGRKEGVALASVLDHCGECDPHRRIELPTGALAPCPNCHPRRTA